MNKKIVFKTVYKIAICIIAILLTTKCYAVTTVVDPTTFDPSTYTGSSTEANNMAGKILGAVQAIGNIVSILALVIIGIKYMFGSVEEKAEYKKTMIPYIVGAILMFASVNIIDALYNVFNQ